MNKLIKITIIFWLLTPILSFLDVSLAQHPLTRQIIIKEMPENPSFLDYYQPALIRSFVEVFMLTIGIFYGRKYTLKELKEVDKT